MPEKHSVLTSHLTASPSSGEDLPIHFFTIVLNGQPFIRYHLEAFKNLPFTWHWHIVEGVAKLVHDTAWSLALSGKIKDAFHRQGRSVDGTSEYLDELAREYPENITVYRKPAGEFWEGKLEMVNAPLANLPDHCLLWEIDADELWSRAQIVKTRELFLAHPEKTAAWFWCHFFVGPDLVVDRKNCYSQNPRIEWQRVWRYRPGMEWAAHEPPTLKEKLPNGLDRDVGTINPFLHYETEGHGLVFQHFAYLLPEQLAFKETYYGYKNATSQWRKLLQSTKRPLFLKDYLSWIKDEATAASAKTLSITPIASVVSGSCRFLGQDQIPLKEHASWDVSPRIIIDGIFFQLARTGIARVWQSLLHEWAKTEFAEHILVLNRDHTAPIVPNLRYKDIPAFDGLKVEDDCILLQQICDLEQADLFISTYHTTPLRTATVYLVHDMIPELLRSGWDARSLLERTFAMLNAKAIIAISESTAKDFHMVHPHIALDQIKVAYPGVANVFQPPSNDSVRSFREKHGLDKPYFLIVGSRTFHKNVVHFFKAFSRLPNPDAYAIVCVGGAAKIEKALVKFVDPKAVHRLDLTDEELVPAYGGALALVYPSLYEGFGLPVLEAMACGCPVITSPASSLPEVGGDAALYTDPKDVAALTQALQDIQQPELRQAQIQKGLKQARLFSWQKMAREIEAVLRQTAAKAQANVLADSSPIFHEMRQLLFKSYALSHPGTKKQERSIKMKIWGKHRLRVSLYQ